MGVTCLDLQQTLSWRLIFDYEQMKMRHDSEGEHYWATERELFDNQPRAYELWVLGFEGDCDINPIVY